MIMNTNKDILFHSAKLILDKNTDTVDLLNWENENAKNYSSNYNPDSNLLATRKTYKANLELFKYIIANINNDLCYQIFKPHKKIIKNIPYAHKIFDSFLYLKQLTIKSFYKRLPCLWYDHKHTTEEEEKVV